MATFKGEETIAIILQNAGIGFERQFKFDLNRKWKADFVIENGKKLFRKTILVEYEGGTWGKGAKQGRHSRGQGYSNDCKKYNAAQRLGYIVLRYTADMIRDDPGQIIKDIKECE